MPSTNPEILRKHRNAWYKKNKKKQIARQLEYRKELARWYQEYKKTLKCKDCGMSFKNRPECLDFHHLDPSKKDGTVFRMISNGKNVFLKELAKCIPLCCNCHRTRHHGSIG